MGGFGAAFELMREAVKAVLAPSAIGVFESLLAVVFIISGAIKLWHPKLAALAIANFGVGRRPMPLLGWTVGFGEVALGALLVASYRPADWLAALLLWLFALLILRSLLIGDRFSCFCFGDLDSTMSWRTLARTLMLAVLATLVVISSAATEKPFHLERLLQLSVAISLIGVAVLVVRILELLRLNSMSLLVLEDAP